ncbi:MAG: (Fe-S)-binding protein [Gracilibacter sp. BRH_c7a]|nr:MAG: (Fe-S)-binding protein [Gracilibacter sp. BRH_c7a]
MKRKIIEINQEKCNGCGLCVNACHEGALQMVNGKAVLIGDEYCDGLGDCLPECPTDAINIIEREAAEFDVELVQERQKALQELESVQSVKLEAKPEPSPCGCPGTRAQTIQKAVNTPKTTTVTVDEERPSQLRQWPIQLNLVNPNASYLQEADLLIAADCTAFAYASFHEKFMKDRITMIGCPKLDDNNYYTEKIAQMIKINNPRSIKLIRMEVPCCGGMVRAVKDAMLKAGIVVPYSEVTVSANGEIINQVGC